MPHWPIYIDKNVSSAAPEVHMDQQWGSANSSVVVKIDCNVHSNPPSQVNELHLINLKN